MQVLTFDAIYLYRCSLVRRASCCRSTPSPRRSCILGRSRSVTGRTRLKPRVYTAQCTSSTRTPIATRLTTTYLTVSTKATRLTTTYLTVITIATILKNNISTVAICLATPYQTVSTIATIQQEKILR